MRSKARKRILGVKICHETEVLGLGLERKGEDMAERNVIWSDRKRTLFGLPLSFTKYTLTEDRLFVQTGFFTTVEDEVRLYRILDVKLTRTLGQKIFGVGTIQVCSADKSMADFEIVSVKNAAEVKERLSELVEKNRVEKRVINRESMFDNDGDSDDDDGDLH